MKHKINLILLSVAILIGSVSGLLITQEKAYAISCENLECKPDFINGFRCFDTGSPGYNCDDSGYPYCSDIRCDIPE